MPRLRTWMAALALLGGATTVRAAPADDPAALAEKINRLLEKSWADNKITPAAVADDAEWLRRAPLPPPPPRPPPPQGGRAVASPAAGTRRDAPRTTPLASDS